MSAAGIDPDDYERLRRQTLVYQAREFHDAWQAFVRVAVIEPVMSALNWLRRVL